MGFQPFLVWWGSKARLSFCETIGLSLGCFSLFFAPCDIIVSYRRYCILVYFSQTQDQLLTSDWFLYELRISYGLVGTLSAPCFTWSLVAALVKRIDLSSDADGPSLGSFGILRGIAWRTVMSHGRFHVKSFVFVRLSKWMSQHRMGRWAKDKEALQEASLIRCLPSADAVPCQMASITRRKNGKRRPWQEWAAWLLCSCFANLLSKVSPPKKPTHHVANFISLRSFANWMLWGSQLELFQSPQFPGHSILAAGDLHLASVHSTTRGWRGWGCQWYQLFF